MPQDRPAPKAPKVLLAQPAPQVPKAQQALLVRKATPVKKAPPGLLGQSVQLVHPESQAFQEYPVQKVPKAHKVPKAPQARQQM